jgi:hypothetical protein
VTQDKRKEKELDSRQKRGEVSPFIYGNAHRRGGRNNLKKEKWLITKQGRSRRNGVWSCSFSRTSPVLLWPNLIGWKVRAGKAGNEI